jgi:NAD+ synthase (glutamine-hydrolysing)
VRRFPYVPNRASHLDADCYEAFNIQVEGLRRRFEATSGTTMVIGVSGGLDSTHALVVAAKACDRLELPRTTILGFTMPGFATGEDTKGNAWALMRALGITAEEIDIRPPRCRCSATWATPSRQASPSTTWPSRTSRRACARTTCSASPTSAAVSSSARGTCRSWLWAGAPTAWATT